MQLSSLRQAGICRYKERSLVRELCKNKEVGGENLERRACKAQNLSHYAMLRHLPKRSAHGLSNSNHQWNERTRSEPLRPRKRLKSFPSRCRLRLQFATWRPVVGCAVAPPTPALATRDYRVRCASWCEDPPISVVLVASGHHDARLIRQTVLEEKENPIGEHWTATLVGGVSFSTVRRRL